MMGTEFVFGSQLPKQTKRHPKTLSQPAEFRYRGRDQLMLSAEDANLFYGMFYPLLNYVNDKHKVNENLPVLHDEASYTDAMEAKKVADYMWEHLETIDEFLADHPDLPEEQREIITSWKKRIRGRFVLERHLQKGSVLLSAEGDGKAYLVSGIRSYWEQMVQYRKPPVFVSTTLIPFKDVIIYDSFLMNYNILIGGNMTRSFKQQYMEAKNSGRLVTTLSETKPVPQKAGTAAKKTTAKKGSVVKKPGIRYTLKVYPKGMGREIYRVIEIAGNKTLTDLCWAIMGSFDFDMDHLYEYIMDDRRNSWNRYLCTYMEDEDYPSTDIVLNRIGLFPGKKFYLHYDFGDDWYFAINVRKIEETEGTISTRIIKQAGELEQYPDYSDEEW